VAITVGVASCATQPQPVVEKPWVRAMHSELEALGKKNWIIVTESSFPAPRDPGAHVIVADDDLPDALEKVLDGIEGEGHVWARIYQSREFELMSEQYAPGVTRFKKRLNKALASRNVQRLPRHSIDILLEAAMEDYRVLIIKTRSAQPYSTVFMELDSGYWDGEAEAALRNKMSSFSAPAGSSGG